MQVTVKFFFKAAQAVVVDTHVTQHLRGDLAVGIKTLELFLEINALYNFPYRCYRFLSLIVPKIFVAADGWLVFKLLSSGALMAIHFSMRSKRAL